MCSIVARPSHLIRSLESMSSVNSGTGGRQTPMYKGAGLPPADAGADHHLPGGLSLRVPGKRHARCRFDIKSFGEKGARKGGPQG